MCEAVSACQNDDQKEEDNSKDKETLSEKKVKWLAATQRQFCKRIELDTKNKKEKICALQVRQSNGMDYEWDMLIDLGASFTSTMNQEPLDNVVCYPVGLNMSTNGG